MSPLIGPVTPGRQDAASAVTGPAEGRGAEMLLLQSSSSSAVLGLGSSMEQIMMSSLREEVKSCGALGEMALEAGARQRGSRKASPGCSCNLPFCVSALTYPLEVGQVLHGGLLY